MSEPFSEELLSAYVDGELPPQVRAAVERWVDNSPEARQKVEDYRRLSRLFGDLPRTEVPGEFPSEVLQLAERRMLLPDAAATRGRQRMRNWALALVVPTAVAAGLLGILNISNRDDAARDRAPIIADRTRSEPAGVASRDAVRTSSLDERAQRPGDVEPSDVQVAQSEPQSREAGRPIGGGIAGARPPSPGSAGMGGGGGSKSGAAGNALAGSKFAAVAPGGPPSSDAESDPQLQAIHQAVQEIRESGAEDKLLLVVRMRMVVVDRADGLALLQKDFAANDIRIDSQNGTEEKAADEAKPKGQTGDQGLGDQGLYVIAEPDELIASFKTFLARQDPVARVLVEESIELAALDAQSQKQLLRGEIEQRPDEPGHADAKQTNRPSQTADSRKKSSSMTSSRGTARPGPDKGIVEKSLRVAPPDGKDSGATGSDASPEANQTTNNARQMVIPAVPPAIQNRARSSDTANSQAARNLAASKSEDAPAVAGATKSRGEMPLAQDRAKLHERAALVRMLIVIEHELQQPDVPAAKKGPGGGAS